MTTASGKLEVVIAIRAAINTTIQGWRRRSQDLSDIITEENDEMGIMADTSEMENHRGARDAIMDCIRDLEKIASILNRQNTPINDGGPVFPQHLAFGPNNEAVTAGMYFAEGPGMTLRDYFMANATFGESDYPPKGDCLIKLMGCDCPSVEKDFVGYLKWHAKFEAIVRGIKADAMITERSKQP